MIREKSVTGERGREREREGERGRERGREGEGERERAGRGAFEACIEGRLSEVRGLLAAGLTRLMSGRG